ncbi:tetratricopeptide repeat protein [Streptomyces sp. NPDC087270]|uniref:AfsR/SARP family transcriptional regulator n=1 Tax=Streptomyces sp. NPDC087270 TaxID=3365774 RepID=UPI00380C5638
MDVDILVLGPVGLRVDGVHESYGAAKRAHFLAALAIDAGQPVGLDILARRLWDNSPPGKPPASLHSYAARVRNRIGADLLVQHAHTYTLAIDPDAVDYHRFSRLAKQARSLVASGDDTRALALVQEAEALRRGTPLTGIGGLWAEQIRRRFQERLFSARMLRYEIELRMGHYDAVADELATAIERAPGDETVTRYYMVAAYGRGQTTAALRTYDALRRQLRAVGTEPGHALARTNALILDQVPPGELLAGKPRHVRRQVPNHLPAHADLVGREEEIRVLCASGPGNVAVQAISGMAGVGKSLLALHTAEKLAQKYPDGQLYVNLRANSGQGALPARSALRTLLRSLDIPAEGLPPELDDLSALWRTVLSTRRAVVVLDDADDPDQLRPLLPGDSPSLVLVTSRRRLTSLPKARHVFLEALPRKSAEALFTARVVAEQIDGDEKLAELVRLAGHLPLALTLLAGRLRSRPTWTVSHLLVKLSDDPGRLAEIRDGSGDEVASAFALSYEQLTPEEQRVFRLLSLHFTPGFGPHATAALTGLPIATTERIIEELYDVSLLGEPMPEHFEPPDLLRLYAHNLTLIHDPEPVRAAAVDRLADFYLHAAVHADRLLFPRTDRIERPLPSGAFALPRWTEARQARAWMVAETSALIAAVRHYRDRGQPDRAAQLADALHQFLDTEGHWTTAEEIHLAAARHWHTAAEPASEARALLALATVRSHLGRYDEAERSGRSALARARSANDPAVEAEALRVLGLTAWDLGRLDECLEFHQAALDMRLRAGDRWHIARSRNNLGISLLHLGDHSRAEECFRAAYAEFVHIGDRRGEGQALNNLGDLHLRRGETESAHDAFSRSLDLVAEDGSRTEYAVGLINVASTLRLPGNTERALEIYRRALGILRMIGGRREESVALVAIGKVLHESGRYAEASAHHTSALTVARAIGATQEEIQALRGLGLSELRSGRPKATKEHLAAALTLAERINAAEEMARCHLALAELHGEAGEIDDATAHSRLAHDYFDTP